MDDQTFVLTLCCAGLLVPFLAGVFSTLFFARRLRTLGTPWAFIPFGRRVKTLWEESSHE